MQTLSLLVTLFAATMVSGRRGRSSSSTVYTSDDTTMLSANSARRKNYYPQAHHVPMLADIGFYSFEFGRKNKVVDTTFHFVLQRPAYFTVTDCYCEGDAFRFVDNGVNSFSTNVNCPLGPYKCRTFESDPWKCLNNGKFCTGNAYLGVGSHNVTITPSNSVTGGGTAFVRLDTLCEEPLTGRVYLCCTTNDNCVKTIFQS